MHMTDPALAHMLPPYRRFRPEAGVRVGSAEKVAQIGAIAVLVAKSEEHRVVTLWGYVCRDVSAKVTPRDRLTEDGIVVDHSGEVIDIYELEKAVWGYVEDSREGDVMHTDRVVMQLVGALTTTPETKKALGLPDDMPEGVILQYRVDDDEAWAAIKDGRLAMGSLFGQCDRVPA
jgi:hypothetical protein